MLSADDLAALVARGTSRSFPRGQALFHLGQVPERVLLLRIGRVKVETTTAAGRSVVLAVRGPGELVGELAALDEQPRFATQSAAEEPARQGPEGHDRLTPAARRARLGRVPPRAFRVLDWSLLRP